MHRCSAVWLINQKKVLQLHRGNEHIRDSTVPLIGGASIQGCPAVPQFFNLPLYYPPADYHGPTRNKKLLGAPGIATRSKDATNGAPGRTTNGARGRYERSRDAVATRPRVPRAAQTAREESAWARTEAWETKRSSEKVPPSPKQWVTP